MLIYGKIYVKYPKGVHEMTKKSKTLISILLFVVLFGGLLLTATFTDLQVSDILTRHALASHSYYTNDPFGATFESVGSAPVYFMLAFSIQILFWGVRRFWKKRPIKDIVEVIGVIAGTAAYYAFLSETVGYLLQHLNAESYKGSAFLSGIALFLAALFMLFGTLAVKNFSDESIKKLIIFAFAMICTVILANAVVAIVKIPFGRMRYRAMNTAGGASIGGFANFTRWYVRNGQMDKAQMMTLFGTTDACKSFPSGHTCAAGMSYGLIMLADSLGIKSKGRPLDMPDIVHGNCCRKQNSCRRSLLQRRAYGRYYFFSLGYAFPRNIHFKGCKSQGRFCKKQRLIKNFLHYQIWY